MLFVNIVRNANTSDTAKIHFFPLKKRITHMIAIIKDNNINKEQKKSMEKLYASDLYATPCSVKE